MLNPALFRLKHAVEHRLRKMAIALESRYSSYALRSDQLVFYRLKPGAPEYLGAISTNLNDEQVTLLQSSATGRYAALLTTLPDQPQPEADANNVRPLLIRVIGMLHALLQVEGPGHRSDPTSLALVSIRRVFLVAVNLLLKDKQGLIYRVLYFYRHSSRYILDDKTRHLTYLSGLLRNSAASCLSLTGELGQH